MGWRTVRGLSATFLPLVCMGLIIASLGTDSWYSMHYLDDVKNDAGFWTEHNVTYGLTDFQYQAVWSDILGQNYIQINRTSTGKLEELGDYMQVSLILLLVFQVPLVIGGFLSSLDRLKRTIPILLALLVFCGLLFPAVYYPISIRNIASEHAEEGFPPAGILLNNTTLKGLKDSSEPGISYWLLVASLPFPFISMLLFIDPPREREPSASRLRSKFFR